MSCASEFDPLATVESLLEVITLAHATIYTQRRRLINLGADDDESRRLLEESAEIVFSQAPRASRRARELASDLSGLGRSGRKRSLYKPTAGRC